MWLFTTIGFYSIAQSPYQPGKVQVRARSEADLDRLRELYPHLGETLRFEGSDYEVRALLDDGRLPELLSEIAEIVDYQNFKSEVRNRQGHRRAGIYADLWLRTQQIARLDRLEAEA